MPLDVDHERFYFSGANCTLSAVEFGQRDKPHMVIVHGMRDHALSMMPLVHEFARDYRILVPDLRGHGDSDNPGAYTMVQFVADLLALVRDRDLQDPVLVGHSLGGHIVSRYAAVYPKHVSKLALLDGMGPPRRPVTPDIEQIREAWRNNIENALVQSSERRAMADAAEALQRLTRNNPRLDHALAKIIVDSGVEPHPDGGVRWKWDPAVGMVWSTFDHGESEQQWRHIESPVLIVTGEYSMQYWTSRQLGDAEEHGLHDEETERRRRLFRHARHVSIPGAGHMLHYDQPALLNQALREFLA